MQINNLSIFSCNDMYLTKYLYHFVLYLNIAKPSESKIHSSYMSLSRMKIYP